MSDKLKNILEWIECIVIAIVLALLIRYYVGTPTVVQMDACAQRGLHAVGVAGIHLGVVGSPLLA